MDPQTDSSTTEVPSFTELNDLASEAVGGKIIFATDDWFASAENLLKSTDPEWREGVFTEFGKWMDGWESRRKRIPGHDWCIIKLGAPGVIHGLDVDTSYFTGNYTPRCSIQAASLSQDLPARSGENRMGTKASEEELQSASKLRSQEWAEILPMTPLKPGYKSTCHSYFKVNSRERWTHLRLNMFPDGGIARLRVYGKVKPDWSLVSDSQEIDLAAMLNGGISVGYSDNHYGHARNVINPGRARIMAEGWETARRMDRPAVLEADEQGVLKVPGHEWAEFKLGHPGIIHKIELDTNHFKGNFPDSCYIEACCDPGSEGKARGPWKLLLPVKKMTAHKRHFYSGNEVNRIGVITHVKMTIAPDGGISRMRLWGHKAKVISAKM